jgi:hypothetical protein
MSEGYDLDDTDEIDPEESPVIKELRSQLRAKEKEAEKLRKLQDEVEARTQSMRADAAEQAVNTVGLPGLKDDVLNWIEGDITQEKVIEALQARSIPLPEAVAQPEPNSEQAPNPSEIGQRVADAAAGGAVRSIEERLSEATTQAEVAAIMEEAGLARSHF